MNINNLHCIDLDQPSLEGFRTFISSWCYKGENATILVDPGPTSTIPHLIRELRTLRVEQIDYILLTHIHIDHAGGTGALLKEFPDAQVICHPEGVRHMVSPEKLWQGSLKVLGKMAETYGEIVPVPEDRIGYIEEVSACNLKVHQTPGHASHHCCYQIGDLLFGGEVTGVHYPLVCSDKGDMGGIYMRPATPPRFILEVALDSIDRMIALEPLYLVVAHYGLVEPAVDYLNIGRKQFSLWVRGVATTLRSGSDNMEDELFQWLLTHDINFANFDQLPADIQIRERTFFGNSMRGMVEYVEGLDGDKVSELLVSDVPASF